MKIIGVTLGWDMKPHLCFENKKYYPEKAEKLFYPEYFKDGEWPTDPVTREKLEIVPMRKEEAKKKSWLSWIWGR